MGSPAFLLFFANPLKTAVVELLELQTMKIN